MERRGAKVALITTRDEPSGEHGTEGPNRGIDHRALQEREIASGQRRQDHRKLIAARLGLSFLVWGRSELFVRTLREPGAESAQTPSCGHQHAHTLLDV